MQSGLIVSVVEVMFWVYLIKTKGLVERKSRMKDQNL